MLTWIATVYIQKGREVILLTKFEIDIPSIFSRLKMLSFLSSWILAMFFCSILWLIANNLLRVRYIPVTPFVIWYDKESVESKVVRCVNAFLNHLSNIVLTTPDGEMSRRNRSIFPIYCTDAQADDRDIICVREMSCQCFPPYLCASIKPAGSGYWFVS